MGVAGMRNKSKTMIAKEYIRDNIQREKKNEIIEYLKEMTLLKSSTLDTLYKEIKRELDIETRHKMRAKKEEEVIKFKGRRRSFFIIDDTNLYKEIKQKE